MVDMPASANSFSPRLRNASTKARVVSWEESSPKRTRLDKPSDIPASLEAKGPLKQSSEENGASFVAKSFYGLVKRQHATADRNKLSFEKSSDISEPVKKVLPGNYKTLMSRLDVLMLEKAALSPVKQAVLQTCSLIEFRKMYKDEYKELEEEMKMQNCIVTRRMSQTVKNKKEEQSLISDSSDDDDSDQDQESKSGNQGSPEVVTDLVAASNHKDMSQSKNCTTPPRRMQHKVNVRNKMTGADGATCVTESTAHGELNTNCKENSQVTNPNEDSSQKLSTPPSSERRFFKSRPSVDSSKRAGMLDKRFNLKFSHTTLLVKDGKKNRGLQKRQSESFSPKRTSVSVTANLSSEKSLQKLPESSISGFIFAPGFLSPDKRGSDNVEEDDDENLDLNQSNCFTYGSPLPKQTVAPNSSSRELDTNPTNPSRSLPDDTNILAENQSANNNARKDVSSDDESSSKQDASHAEENSETSPQHKLFPIFWQKSGTFARSNKKRTNAASPSPSSSKLPKDINNSQMIIDAGQKKIGATQCNVCGMVYCLADQSDDNQHAKFHKQLVEVLKFPGWKKERVVQEYPEDLGRVILVLPDDAKYARKKVEEVNQLMGRELGFPDTAAARLHPYHKVFFYVEDKQITGCCVAESVQEGYRIIPGDLDDSQESGQRPWCCAQVSEPVSVGISRLWVAAEKRRHGVSTKLVDSVRQWYNYGSLIPKHRIAFSDPTPDGRRFAQKYTGTPTFLVYKFSYG